MPWRWLARSLEPAGSLSFSLSLSTFSHFFVSSLSSTYVPISLPLLLPTGTCPPLGFINVSSTRCVHFFRFFLSFEGSVVCVIIICPSYFILLLHNRGHQNKGPPPLSFSPFVPIVAWERPLPSRHHVQAHLAPRCASEGGPPPSRPPESARDVCKARTEDTPDRRGGPRPAAAADHNSSLLESLRQRPGARKRAGGHSRHSERERCPSCCTSYHPDISGGG